MMAAWCNNQTTGDFALTHKADSFGLQCHASERQEALTAFFCHYIFCDLDPYSWINENDDTITIAYIFAFMEGILSLTHRIHEEIKGSGEMEANNVYY